MTRREKRKARQLARTGMDTDTDTDVKKAYAGLLVLTGVLLLHATLSGGLDYKR